MRKIWVVAAREFNAAVRTKAFLIGLVIMPLMMGGSILVQLLLKDMRDTKEKHFAVLDRSADHRYYAAIEAEVTRYNDEAAGQRKRPPFVVERIEGVQENLDAVNEWRAILSDRVRDGKLLGFVEIGPDVAQAPSTDDADGFRHAFRYQTNRPTHREFPLLVEQAVTQRVQQERAAKQGQDITAVRQILQPVPLAKKGLSRRDPLTQKVEEASDLSLFASIIVPMAMMVLMFMVVMMSATPLMQGVVEEKMQRIAEVLLGSVEPFQLMLGKLLGMTGVSLTMAGVYLGAVYWAARYYGFAEAVSPGLIAWFVIFQALAGLMYGSLFIAIGAACTDMKETQNLLWPVMLLATMPMFVLGPVLQEPNSPVAMTFSFFPFATPMLMIARLAVPPGIDWWQPVLGAVLVLVTTLLCVWAAGRIFRVGLLMQGKGASLGELMRWVFRG